jgi:hypothetical protein
MTEPFSAAEYCARDKDGSPIVRARDEVLCAELRTLNHERMLRVPKRPFGLPGSIRPFCGHCFTPVGVSVRFNFEARTIEPTGRGPVEVNADGVIAGIEACAECGHNFGLLLTAVQRAALLRGEAAR